MGNKVCRAREFLSGLKSVHLSLTERQLSRDPGGCKVDLHNYIVVIYDGSPDVSPEERKFLARAPRRGFAPTFRETISRESRGRGRDHCAPTGPIQVPAAPGSSVHRALRGVRPSFLAGRGGLSRNTTWHEFRGNYPELIVREETSANPETRGVSGTSGQMSEGRMQGHAGQMLSRSERIFDAHYPQNIPPQHAYQFYGTVQRACKMSGNRYRLARTAVQI